MKKTIFLALLVLTGLGLAAQTSITGRVTGADDKLGLPGATVMIKGSTTLTTCDADGNYRISVSREDILVFSFIGYVSQEVPVGTRSVINVELLSDATMLEETVVVGFGTQKKENLTGAVSTVDVGKTLDSRPISDIGRALQGTTPGLSITTTSGEIGGSPTIRIRGTVGSPNGSSNPLILIDNVAVPDLSYINPDDVESISIMKDAASTAIYGSRAAFGVILVTTKSKKVNEFTTVKYSNNFAWRTPTTKPEQLPAWQQAELTLEALNHYGFAPTDRYAMLGSLYVTEASAQKMKEWERLYGGQNLGNELVYGRDFEFIGGNQLYYRPWDWYDMFYKDWMPQQSHNLSVNGGNGNISYNMALGYLHQSGMTKTNPDTYDKYNASINVNAKAYKWLNLRAGAMLTKTEREKPFITTHPTSTLYDYMYYLWRWQPIYPYGTYNGKPLRGAITDLEQANMNVTTHNYSRWNIGATAAIIDGLTLDVDFNYTATYREIATNGSTAYGMDFWNAKTLTEFENSYKKYNDVLTEYAQRNNRKSETYTANAYLTYSKTIKEHHALKGMVGTNIEWNETSYIMGKKMGLLNASKPEPNLADGIQSINSSHTRWAVAGFFSRINYAFKDRYLIEVNGRYDGSTSFPHGEYWGFFPSMSIGYRLTEEPFMDVVKPYLSSFKLRGSYGSVGNQTSEDEFSPTMSPNATYSWLINNDRSMYFSTPRAISPTVTWETVTTLDLGFDARFWKDKIGVSFDWYTRTTSDIITSGVALPNTFGLTPPRQNVGELRTNGWEIMVDFHHTFSNGIRLNLSGQLTDYKTKVIKWHAASQTIPGYNTNNWTSPYYEGKMLGDIWGYRADRLFQVSDFTWDATNQKWIPNPGIADQSALESGSFRFGPGDVKYKDLDNSGAIDYGNNTADNSGDKTIIGNALPRYQYGFRIGAEWKGFDFDVFFQGVGKRDLWAGGNMIQPNNTTGEPWFKGQDDSWSLENPDAFYPVPTPYAQQMKWNYEINDRYLLDMSYLRCKTMTLGYTIPSKITEKVRISRLRVYFTAENLFTFHNLGDIPVDPETGINWGENVNTGAAASDLRNFGRYYPYQRVLSFGVQVGF
ncbi:MAG: TonB-dependent receptor [Prevotellaceae bacterium]|jgi:TonB-linked SusC/RagA family outer membrane protein|nr:TonB-dependent receptor [Prevotellaceae bacterium]